MADGTYRLIKENAGGTFDEKTVLAENGKVLGFDSGLNPIMVTPGVGVVATGAELNTGTDDVKYASAKALYDSEYRRIYISGSSPADTTKLWMDTSAEVVEPTSSNTFTNKTITSSTNVLGGVTMTLGSDADGDIYYRSSNVLTRLAKGTAYQKLTMNSGATAPNWSSDLEVLGLACSDMSTALTTGEKVAFDIPFNFVVTRVYASVKTAPVGSALTIDVEDEGATILNAVVSISASTNNAETSTFTGSASSYTFTKGDLVSIDIDQVGSSTAGAGLIVFLEGYRT